MNASFSRVLDRFNAERHELKAQYGAIRKVPLSQGKLRLIFSQLLSLHATPQKKGLAVALGLAIGLSPFYGFHLLIALGLSLLFLLNPFLVYLAANISLPIFIPGIVFFQIHVGQWVRALFGGSFEKFAFFQSIEDLLLGYLVSTPLICLFGGALTVILSNEGHKRWKPFKKKRDRISKALGHFNFLQGKIAHSKMTWDPVYRILERLPKTARSVLDLGGGEGFASLLMELPSTVIDWDQRRIALGESIAKDLQLPVRFVRDDLQSLASLPKADRVLAIDVLHYFPDERQKKLIALMIDAVEPGGELCIRDIDAGFRLRTAITRLQELVSILASRTKAKPKIYPQKFKTLETQLRASGFKVHALKAWGLTPFANRFLIARKPL